MKNILIVEDELVISLAYKIILSEHGYTVTKRITNGLDAIEFINNNEHDLMILDIKLKGEMSGLELANKIREQSDTPIIFTSGNSHLETTKLHKQIPNSLFLVKPVEEKTLIESVKNMLETG